MNITMTKEKDVIKKIMGHMPAASTISRLRQRGDLPPSIQIGRTRYCQEEAVLSWLEQRAAGKN